MNKRLNWIKKKECKKNKLKRIKAHEDRKGRKDKGTGHREHSTLTLIVQL